MQKYIQDQKMPLTIPLRKVGNSYMLTIPQTLMKLYGLSEGTEFEVLIDKDNLVLKSRSKRPGEKYQRS